MSALEPIKHGFDVALNVQRPLVVANIKRLSRTRPDASPAKIIGALEAQYRAIVITNGAAVGGAAAVPGVGTAASLAISGGEIVAFLEASALFALAVAEVHGISVTDIERRRALVTAIMLGNSGTEIIRQAAGRTGGHWGKAVTSAVPMESIRAANRILGHNFITKYGTKQGIIVIGRVAPFGIGAGIGAAGNALMARTVVRSAKEAFGAAPERLPKDLRWS